MGSGETTTIAPGGCCRRVRVVALRGVGVFLCGWLLPGTYTTPPVAVWVVGGGLVGVGVGWLVCGLVIV